MALTLAEIFDLQAEILQFDLDNYKGEVATRAERLHQINWAIRMIARTVEKFDPKITLTLTVGDYSFNIRNRTAPATVSRKVHKLKKVYINGVVLKDPVFEEGLWAMPDLDHIRRNWRRADSDVPTAAVYIGDGLLILNPPPTQAVLDDAENWLAGTWYPDDMAMSDVGTSPSLVEELHEAVAYFAAEKAAVPSLSEDMGWRRLRAFRQEWVESVGVVRRENRNALIGDVTIRGHHERDFMAT